MEMMKSALWQWIDCSYDLLKRIKQETERIKPLVLRCGVTEMFKRMFEAVEAMLRAIIYLLILVTGASIARVGAFIIIFLAIRFAQLVYELILKSKWI